MNHGVVPAQWLAVLGRWDASFLLRVAAECDKQGVAHSDIPGVKRVAHMVSYMERFKFTQEES